MTQQRDIVKGDVLQRIGSAGLIVGAILFGMSGLLMPHAANPTSDLQEMLKPLGESQFRTYVSALSMAIGFLAVLMGAAGVYHSITATGAAWARLGFYVASVGTVLWTVCLSLDVGTASSVANWLAAPAAGRELAHSLLTTLFPPGAGFGRGLFPLAVIANWLAIAFLGMGMARSAVYPRWLGGLGLILGGLGLAAGIVMTYVGREAVFAPFTALAFATLLWVLASGLWMARQAW
jgi:hypothetical protein